MAGALSLNIVVGAALASGFRGVIDGAKGKIGEVKTAAVDMGQALADMGTAFAGLAMLHEAKSAAVELQAGLMDAGITADMTDQEVAALRRSLRDLAVPEKTNQSVADLLKGFTALVGAGMDQSKAQASMYALGRTATAANADIEDLSKTAFVLIDTLGVTPGNLSAELDRLAFAGKQGAFELKDMAKYFPVLGASAKNLGLQGTEAVATLGAALQIAKKGAADPAEAANNMKNFLAKATAPETVKRFEKHGVNLKKVLKDAMAKGENPMEVLVAKIQKMTKGDPFKIGELFGDMQVMDFLKPMLANMDQYKKLKGEILAAQGTVDTDYARRMGTAKEGAKATAIAFQKLGEAVGHSFLPFISGVGAISGVVEWLAAAADQSPTTTLALTGVAVAFTVLGPAIRAATIAWRLMNVAVIASPVGLAIAAVAVGAALIIDNWSTVAPFFAAVWDGISAGIAWVGENITEVLKYFGPIGWAASAIITHWTEVKSFFGGLWDGVQERFAAVVAWVQPIIGAGGPLLAAWAGVQSFFSGLWDGVAAGADRVFAAFGATGGAGATITAAWAPVGAFFSGLWDGVVANIDTVLYALGPLGLAARLIIDNWTEVKGFLLGVWDEVATKWTAAIGRITALWNDVSSPLATAREWLGLGDGKAPAGGAKPAAPGTQAAAPAKPAPLPAPGAAVAAAEERGRAAMAPPAPPPAPAASGVASTTAPVPAPKPGAATMAAAAAAGAPAAPASPAAKPEPVQVLVTVDFKNMPAGVKAEAKSSSPQVRVEARTGQAMAGPL